MLPMGARGDIRGRRKIPALAGVDASMPIRAGFLTLALALLVAAPARAAEFDVTAFALTPSSTAAGAHADVTIATSFTPYDAAAPPPRPRNVVFHLPPGLAGDPFSTPRCSEAAYRADACPRGVEDRQRRGGRRRRCRSSACRDSPQTATGDLYNLVPGGHRARAARRRDPPDRRPARQAVRADDDPGARERRRPRLDRHRPADGARRDRAVDGADGVHAAGPPRRRAPGRSCATRPRAGRRSRPS